MQLIFELTFLIPLISFCFGRVLDNASSREIRERVLITDKDGRKFTLRPTVHIRNGPGKVAMVAGDAKYLECEAGGSPPPTIHWLKDGKRIDQNFYEAVHPDENDMLPPVLGLSFTRSRLYIDCASSRDAGKYTCVAENKYLRDSKTGQLFVDDTLDGHNNAICLTAKKTFGSPARVHMWTRTRLEMMGTDAQLFCRSSGYPQPKIMWRGPNEDEPLENSRKYQIMENGDLIIRNLEWEDMGRYTCRVKNSEGSDETVAFLYPTAPNKEEDAKV